MFLSFSIYIRISGDFFWLSTSNNLKIFNGKGCDFKSNIVRTKMFSFSGFSIYVLYMAVWQVSLRVWLHTTQAVIRSVYGEINPREILDYIKFTPFAAPAPTKVLFQEYHARIISIRYLFLSSSTCRFGRVSTERNP